MKNMTNVNYEKCFKLVNTGQKTDSLIPEPSYYSTKQFSEKKNQLLR